MDQKEINKFIKVKSELKGNKQVKTKNFESDRKCQKYGCHEKKVVRPFMLIIILLYDSDYSIEILKVLTAFECKITVGKTFNDFSKFFPQYQIYSVVI